MKVRLHVTVFLMDINQTSFMARVQAATGGMISIYRGIN